MFVLARDGAQVLRSSIGSEFSSFRTLKFQIVGRESDSSQGDVEHIIDGLSKYVK